MQERRRQARKSLMAYTQVFDLYKGDLLGYMGDLNTSGAMVISEKIIPEGSTMTLSMELPELPGVTATRMVLPCRVAWCQPDISPDYYNIGFEFQQVKAEQAKIIEAIMQHYEFKRDLPDYPIPPRS